MLERAELSDVEGLYRHNWLITASLEDYFALRDRWYGGSKEAFKWLRDNDSAVHDLFQKVLSGASDHATIQKLMRSVYQWDE